MDYDDVMFKKSIEDINWPYFGFQDMKIKELQKEYDIKGIPKLIVIDTNANLITKDGRKEICLEGNRAFKRYLSKAKPYEKTEEELAAMEVEE